MARGASTPEPLPSVEGVPPALPLQVARLALRVEEAIESTYWYLESTPQLMTDNAAQCEGFFRGESS